MWHASVERSLPHFLPLWLDECHGVQTNANNAPTHPRRFRSVWNSEDVAEDAAADWHSREMFIFTPSYTHMHINSQDMLANCSTHLCTDIIMYGRTVDYVHWIDQWYKITQRNKLNAENWWTRCTKAAEILVIFHPLNKLNPSNQLMLKGILKCF